MILFSLILLLLVGVNALCVGAEFAVVAVQRSQIAFLARAGNEPSEIAPAHERPEHELDPYVASATRRRGARGGAQRPALTLSGA
jgi:CBS domain containing-hemolysin-like protein